MKKLRILSLKFHTVLYFDKLLLGPVVPQILTCFIIWENYTYTKKQKKY